MGLGRGTRGRSTGVQEPAFSKRGAVTDLNRDAKAVPLHLCPERIGLVVLDRISIRRERSQNVHRFSGREHMVANVMLGSVMLAGSPQFLEYLPPIPHRLAIHLNDHISYDRWTYSFIGESEMNVGRITRIELEDWPNGGAHLLALHIGGVTGNE